MGKEHVHGCNNSLSQGAKLESGNIKDEMVNLMEDVEYKNMKM